MFVLHVVEPDDYYEKVQRMMLKWIEDCDSKVPSSSVAVGLVCACVLVVLLSLSFVAVLVTCVCFAGPGVGFGGGGAGQRRVDAFSDPQDGNQSRVL